MPGDEQGGPPSFVASLRGTLSNIRKGVTDEVASIETRVSQVAADYQRQLDQTHPSLASGFSVVRGAAGALYQTGKDDVGFTVGVVEGTGEGLYSMGSNAVGAAEWAYQHPGEAAERAGQFAEYMGKLQYDPLTQLELAKATGTKLLDVAKQIGDAKTPEEQGEIVGKVFGAPLAAGVAGGLAFEGVAYVCSGAEVVAEAGALGETAATATGETGAATGEAIEGAAGEGMGAAEVAPQQGAVADANFAQSTTNSAETFSDKGSEIYTELAGRDIKTIDDLTEAIRNGAIKPEELPVDYIVQPDGTKLILNTRTSVALDRAGVSKAEWYGSDKTGLKVPDMGDTTFNDLAKDQLRRNKLPSTGSPNIPKGRK